MIKTLTLETVKNAAATGKQYYITDAKLSGFALRVSRAGARTYVVRHRGGGVPKDHTIGSPDNLSPTEARELAMALKLELNQKETEQLNPDEPKKLGLYMASSLFLAEKCSKDYEVKWVHKNDGPRKNLPKHIVEMERGIYAFTEYMRKDIDIEKIKRRDIYLFHISVGRLTKPQANRFLSYLSSFFSYFVDTGDIEFNPCQNIKKFKEEPNKQGVPEEKYRDFIELLKQEEDTPAAEAVIFSMLTGVRTSTTLSLCWQNNGKNNYVDLDNSRLIIRHHKNKKNKAPYVVPILDVASAHLSSMTKQTGNNYVFSSRKGSHITKKRYTNTFYSALKKLDINEDLKELITPYCTRHSFSSYLANKGMSFEDIAQLLTHSTTRMLKERYGHLEEGYKTKLKTRLDSAFTSEV